MAWEEAAANNADSAGEKSVSSGRRALVRLWLIELGALTAIIGSLWVKQIYFNITQRAAWAAPEESFWQWGQSHLSVLSLSLAILLLLFGLFPLIPRFLRFGLLLVLNLILTSLIVADIIHAQFFGAAVSVLSLANTHMLGTVIPSVVEALRPAYLIFYLDFILGIIALPYYRRASRSIPRLERRHTASVSTALLVVGLLLFSPSARVMEEKHQQGLTMGFQREICSALGLFPYHFWDVVYNLRSDHTRSRQEDLNRTRLYLNEVHQVAGPRSELFGAARGKNLILISAESFQAFPIGLEVDGQPVTPRLSAFIRESLYFSNFYDQTSQGRTSDGEFIALNSLHPLSIGDIPTQYNANFFYGVPTILAHEGYTTLSACAAPGTVWSMKVMHSRYNFQQSFYEDSFREGDRLNGAWMVDGDFFAQVVPLLESQKQPFMAFMLSSSSHHPFKMPQKFRTLKLGKLEGTRLGDYLHSARYFDQSFGEFIDGLRQAGLLDQCVIAVYGDHRGVWAKDVPQLAQLLGASEQDEYYRFKVEKRVPFIVRLPHGAAARQIDIAAGHLDIAPTLLGLLGQDFRQAAMLGQDLTLEREHMVVFRDGSFADGRHFYINRPDPTQPPTCYVAATGEKISCDKFEEQRRAALERLEISDIIISGNLVSEIVANGDSAPQRGSVNALSNPGFEDLAEGKPTAWGIAGNPVVDILGLYAADGKTALQSKGVRDVFYQTVAVKPDSVYLVECYARATAPDQQGRLQINWLDAEGKLLKEQVEIFKATQRWERYGRIVIPPPKSAVAAFYAGALDPGAVWFDNLFLGETRVTLGDSPR